VFQWNQLCSAIQTLCTVRDFNIRDIIFFHITVMYVNWHVPQTLYSVIKFVLFSNYKSEREIEQILPFCTHDINISTITCSTSLWSEHVVVVSDMVSSLEAISTQGHARRHGASSTSVGDEVSRPDEPTDSCIIILTY